ncbi:ribosome recycling factor family protein [Agarivorans sp. B2Z047]|uniref:ribosome recycling factor family protein n=1 Tax=Agarivorans sp. B2Z047 TaxID=2652721 RepID=UPI001D15CC79|nr:ribosome recycling factor family protein [Agarivorans sp. B2Z047]UQN44613.1 ribosome recycling factor family protein [Agarivorans sp. B2Z047]
MQNSPMKNKDFAITVALPSLIHRIGGDNTKQAKQLALESACQLKRIRRSRNWQLIGEASALSALSTRINNLESDNFAYLLTKLELRLAAYQEQLEPKSERLARLIKEKPNITLAELLEQTDCSLAEARLARFDAEL